MFKTASAALILAGALTVAGCASNGSASSAASAAASRASAVATSSAVIAARAKAMNDVVNPCKPQLPGLVAFKNCAETRMGITGPSQDAKARRDALGTCLFEAAAADHLTTAAGRLAFETAGAPDCVATATP
jgi:hypothetical protein